MSVGLTRASLFGIKKQSEVGQYLKPTVGAEILPLRPGNELSYEPELIENDELLNDIGAAKAAIGKEVVSGKHSAYLRHSGVEGVEPQLTTLYESILGTKFVVAVEGITIASSTTTKIKVGVGLGVNYRVGQALLIKDGVNGYSIRNIKAIVGDELELNFKLNTAPGAGINLGKAVLYIPAAQGHPIFSTTKYLGNGFAIEASANNTATNFTLTAAANGYGEVEFSYEGTSYLFNPIDIIATNKFIDFIDDSGELSISVPEKNYRTPIELADAIGAAFNSVSAEDFTVTYNNTDGKFVIVTTSTVFSLLFATGDNVANSMALTIGFTATDKTGSQTYTSDNAQAYECPIVPTFDTGDIIVMKNVDLYIGDQSDNICVCAQEVGLTIGKEVEDVDCMCEESGVSEKIPVSREAEMTATISLRKYDASLLDALLKNKGISAMMNSGHKLGGNWIGGKNFNFYLQSCTVSKYTTTGDSFIQVDLALKGYVSTTTKDIYLNFV